MSSTILEPEVEIPVGVELPIEENPEPPYGPGPTNLKQRVRDLLITIFKGHEEYLGWTPD
jgi:hypothetical protein